MKVRFKVPNGRFRQREFARIAREHAGLADGLQTAGYWDQFAPGGFAIHYERQTPAITEFIAALDQVFERNDESTEMLGMDIEGKDRNQQKQLPSQPRKK